MADNNHFIAYGPDGVAITIIFASLADGSRVVSSEIDFSALLYFGALLQLIIKTGASGVSSDGVIRVYVIASADGGTSYPGTPNNQLLLLDIFNANVNGTTFISNLKDIALAFGGKLPKKVKLVVENATGAALDAAEGNHSKFYQGVHSKTVSP